MTHTNHIIKSRALGKDMNVRVYGTKGYPVIAFPTQDQMADEWEANGMTDVFAPYVDDGRLQLFTVDSNDLESWSDPSDDFAARIARQEDYFDFVCDELLPYVHQANGSELRPELTGCSLGATQATICALRRPDLFQGAIALSGMYHTSYFFGDWGNDTSYANDVNAFLPNTPLDHPYIELYRHRTFAFAIGQAADEQFGVSDLHFLQQTFDRLGISGWFDFWGPESNHDWYWWKQQMAKFLPEAVKELEGVAQAEPELAKAPKAKAEAKVTEKAKKAAHDKAASAHKAAKETAHKAEEKAAEEAKRVQAEAVRAKEQAEEEVTKAVKRTEEKATRAKAQTKERAEEAKAKAEAKKEELTATKASTKAAAASTAKAAQAKAAAKAADVAKKASAAKETATKKAAATKAKATATAASKPAAKAKAATSKAQGTTRKAGTTARKPASTTRKASKKSAK